MVKRANRKSGSQHSKKRKNIILIAAEGINKTETGYFSEFNRLQNNYRIASAFGNNTDPVKIVEDAVKSAEKKEPDLRNGDRIYAVFDTDFGKENQIEKARRNAEKNGVKLLLSNPSFEVWLLLHFKYSTKSYSSNKELLNELTTEWPEYRKNIKSFEYIMGKLPTAIANAIRLEKHHKTVSNQSVSEYWNPSTEVHELAKLLIKE